MKIPILSGIYTDQNGDYRVSYPRNYMPIMQPNGINEGYLRPAQGIEEFCQMPGMGRGGINWNGDHYRVAGSRLIKISAAGVITTIGTISGGGNCKMDYSFDRLAIASGGMLYYYDGTTLSRVTDADLGTVLDFIWVDGYFMTTDGEYLVVTELTDPTAINPLKYGSSEIDPDPIKRVLKVRNEPCAINRYTTERFRNVGGSLFPFQRITGAQTQKGCVGSRAACVLDDVIFMLGGGRNEQLAIWAVGTGDATKISTREIDLMLAEYDESDLESVIVEARSDSGQQLVYFHLPDKTIVYDMAASKIAGTYVWFTLTSGNAIAGKYKARNFTYINGEWYCDDPTSQRLGRLNNSISSHYGDAVSWDFATVLVYNGGKGAIFFELELVGLPGRSTISADTSVWTNYTLDGQNWSARKYTTAGARGALNARVSWFRQGSMRQYRAQRFGGTSDSHFSVSMLEANLEPLNA